MKDLTFGAASSMKCLLKFGNVVDDSSMRHVRELAIFIGNSTRMAASHLAITYPGYVLIVVNILLMEFFSLQNHKRVAVVWMDEYAEYIYKRSPNMR